MEYSREDAESLLARTPHVLRAMLLDMPAEWLNAPEKTGAWSPRDVACHMADLERDGWIPRVRFILVHGEDPPLPGIQRERFREQYRGATIAAVLDDFQRLRSNNLDELRILGLDEPGALNAVGRHETFGRVTVAQMLSTWVVHDLTHLAQVSRTLAAQYRDAVGPWREFLSILR